MLFGTKRRISRTKDTNVLIRNQPLERVQSHKYIYLGVTLDPQLSWNDHVEGVCKKVRQRLGVRRRIRNYMDIDLSDQLFHALILAIRDYGNGVYGACSKSTFDKLQKLEKRVNQIILHVPYKMIHTIIMFLMNWNSLT